MEEARPAAPIVPYLSFDGQARQALELYRSIFGGELQIRTFEDFGTPEPPDPRRVMHGVLVTPLGYTLMAWDLPDRVEHDLGATVSLYIRAERPLVHDYFRQLLHGGHVELPLQHQPWGGEVGTVRDPFGVRWMFRAEESPDAPATSTQVPRRSAEDLDRLLDRLATQDFRSKFRLRGRDRAIVDLRGITTVRKHAEDIVRKRIAPSEPVKDGRQTPYRGHPVFVAQHATATCCRSCLSKWHHIRVGRALNEDQITYVVDVICQWIRREYAPQDPPK